MIKTYYDSIADDYEKIVIREDEEGHFPYDGYQEILRAVAEEMTVISRHEKATPAILDVGIGTGYLYTFYAAKHCDLTGIDISGAMLGKARKRIPQGRFFESDVNHGFPDAVHDKRYDAIVSTYMSEHINHTHLMRLIERSLPLLKPFGKLMIAGPIFFDYTTKKVFQRKHYTELGASLYFHVYESIVSEAPQHLSLSFLKIKPHAGIILVEKSYEYALQMEESLVEYNRNTMKWKSSQSRKKKRAGGR